jgi:hypothetical protein
MYKKLKNCSDLTQLDLSGYENVGFHGTSVLSAEHIELNGFLPYKIFESHEHVEILEIAQKFDVDCHYYCQWLEMLSVTFTKEAIGAINHIESGSHSGQGLANVRKVLQSIVTVGDGVYKSEANQFLSRIEMLENAQPILYVVNLSGYGKRLASDNICYYYHLNPALPFPENSDIGPDRIIARLDHFNGK